MTYEEQVETITTVLSNAQLKNADEVDRMLMFYILDMSYDRGAICEARKKVVAQIRETGPAQQRGGGRP